MSEEENKTKTNILSLGECLGLIARSVESQAEVLTQQELSSCAWHGLHPHFREKDFFWVRAKFPGGFMGLQQLSAIAEVAKQYSKGFADITARQNMQIHWCSARMLSEILEKLSLAGISTSGSGSNSVRNIVGCPVSGIDRDQAVDPQALINDLSRELAMRQDLSSLPGELKISISGCKGNCVCPQIHCVSLLASQKNIDGNLVEGFEIWVGGGLSPDPSFARPVDVFVTSEQAKQVLIKIVEIWNDASEYRQDGRHSRFRHLVPDWTVERLRHSLQERTDFQLERASKEHHSFSDRIHDHIGVHAQKQDGLYYIGVPVLAGRIKSDQMLRIAELTQRYSDMNLSQSSFPIRLSPQQNIIIANVLEANVDKFLSGLSEIGLSINAHPLRRAAMTCSGLEFCKYAKTETKSRIRDFVEYLEKRVNLEEPIRFSMSGCDKACAHHPISHIGLIGTKVLVQDQLVDAYDLQLCAELGQNPGFARTILDGIQACECVFRIEKLLIAFRQGRKPGESFNAWCRRVGDERLLQFLSADEEKEEAVNVAADSKPAAAEGIVS